MENNIIKNIFFLKIKQDFNFIRFLVFHSLTIKMVR